MLPGLLALSDVEIRHVSVKNEKHEKKATIVAAISTRQTRAEDARSHIRELHYYCTEKIVIHLKLIYLN